MNSRQQKQEQKKKRKKANRAAHYKSWTESQKAIPRLTIHSSVAMPEWYTSSLKELYYELFRSEELDPKTREDLRDLSLRKGKKREDALNANPLDRLENRVGELLYPKLLERYSLDKLRPYDFEVGIDGSKSNHVHVFCRALVEPFPHLFCSPMRWSLLIGDSEKTVVFSSHALEQIEERAVIDSKRYVEKGFFFAIPYSYRRFELVKLPSGQDAIRIWNWCDPNMFLGKLFFELIGPGNAKMHRTSDGRTLFIRDQEPFFYLVGYCPLDVHDKDANYVVCKTLLLPGMDNTPEHLAFLRSKKRDTIERAEFGKRVGKSTFKHLFQSKDFNVFRELHGYVPQVKPIPGEVFHYPGMKPV